MVERIAAHRLQRRGKVYQVQFPRIGERPLLHNPEIAVLCKSHARERRIEECIFRNVLHICGNYDFRNLTARKGIRLYARERIGQNNARYGCIIEGITADRDNISAQIERG